MGGIAMEHKIGEIFECDDRWYQCLKSDGACKGCAGEYNDFIFCKRFNGCTGKIFKELEKVGIPYISSRNKKRYQLYKCFYLPITTKDSQIEIGDANFVGIEIKQDKVDMEEKKEMTLDEAIKHCEDIVAKCGNKKSQCALDHEQLHDWLMELKQYKEKKLSNPKNIGNDLKIFNLEAAKAGKPVCTRDGRKVRIICFDAEGNKPLIVLSKIDGKEVILRYTEKGRSDNFHSPTPREDDLMMLPEKMEGWVNVYNDSPIYKTKEDAEVAASSLKRLIATVKVEWEE